MKRVTMGNVSSGKAHFTAGIISNGMLYISGQLPIDPSTGSIVAGGVAAQTKSSLSNVERILHEAGLTKENVVQCRVYVTDISDWEETNSAYAEFFGDHRPVRVLVPVRDLNPGVLVEIEAVAEAYVIA